MRTAKDIMTSPAITIGPDADITEAAKILLDRDINGLPVVDDSGRVAGIICQSDLVRMQKFSDTTSEANVPPDRRR